METLDVSPGEVVAVADYTNEVIARAPSDFIAAGGNCLLCGRWSQMVPARSSAVYHLHSKDHRRHAAQYRACTIALLTHEKHALDARDGCASRREIVLVYLGHRLARTDMIVGGLQEYNHAAVGYLLRRASAPDLMRAFGRIQGREYDISRGMCSICLERPSSVLFQSCSHLCACRLCVAKLKVRQDEDPDSGDSDNGADVVPCPICRKVGETTTVFIV
jgi:hypothetical protein